MEKETKNHTSSLAPGGPALEVLGCRPASASTAGSIYMYILNLSKSFAELDPCWSMHDHRAGPAYEATCPFSPQSLMPPCRG